MKLLTTILLFCVLSSYEAKAQDVVSIPNIFTPNGDGDNDFFRINSNAAYETLTCTIFNRFGEPIYRFYGLNGSWDGYTHAGVKVSAGVYFVLVEVATSDGTSDTQQGTVQVLY